MRLDPNALGTVFAIGVVAIAGALGGVVAPTAMTSVAVVGIAGALGLVLGVRLLVDRAGLDLEVVRALVREQGVKKGACPSCTGAMHEGRLRGLLVDLCLACGALWLDKGELTALARENAFQPGGAP